MLPKLGHWLVVSALVFTIGAHWAILQSVAWVSMAVSYSQHSTLKDALSKTFDGLHPCKLCKVVQEGKKSEKKPKAVNTSGKLDLFCPVERAPLKAPPFILATAFSAAVPSPLTEAPPKPPPRQIPC